MSQAGKPRPGMFGLLLVLGLSPLLVAQGPANPASSPDRAAEAKRERLLKIYTHDAQEYTVFRDASRTERVALQEKPVYVWTNPTRAGGQDGMVFVWTCRGRAEVVGTIFSFPGKGKRGVAHEFHSLGTTVLDVSRSGSERPDAKSWTPQGPGITLEPIPDAPAPASSAPRRLAQMRELVRGFSGTTADQNGRQWKLRLLPKPFYRYESTDPEVIDGALFAFVTSAGTDPEALVVLEARKAPGAEAPTWQYAPARYTDMSLTVRYKGREILSVPFLSGTDSKDRYRVLEDRIIPPVEDDASTVGP